VATGISARRNNGPLGTDSAGMAGIITGPQELVRRSLLAYQRTEEQAADRAAVRFLDATRQSSKGLLATLQRFSNDALFQTSQLDPYLQSHPLPAERISSLQQLAKASLYYEAKDAPALQARHDLMRAKLVGFLGDMSEIARRYPSRDTSGPARYARAISAYRFGRLPESLTLIDALIAAEASNPYFWELKGQVLLESGRAAEALAPLRKATAMAPGAVPMKVLYGHALVATDTPANTAEAVGILANATQRDQDSAEAFQYLAMAYHRKGETPKAQLAAAQGLFVSGKYVEARTQASRAQAQFKEGSPGWLKADDILNYRPPKTDGIFD
jgi:predicted Zn-dependent protease